jgi:hypothetical protein
MKELDEKKEQSGELAQMAEAVHSATCFLKTLAWVDLMGGGVAEK